jgi:transcriptional regulator with XRE-family HTH domain
MILEARRAAGMTQADLSAHTGITKSTISLYENGLREPGAETFLRLLDATGSDVAIRRFSDEQRRRGMLLSDLLAFASELPNRWPGDDLQFPAGVWKRA